MSRTIDIAAEDMLSAAALRAVLQRCRTPTKVGLSYPVRKHAYGPNGYGYIKKNLAAFNATAIRPFVALIDADDRLCPPETIKSWLDNKPQNPNLIVRVAVRTVEAWLLADSNNLSHFLSVSTREIPTNPDTLVNPKQAIVDLAKKSKLKDVRSALIPTNANGRTGPYYNQMLSQFCRSVWDPSEAAKNSGSLRKTLGRLDCA